MYSETKTIYTRKLNKVLISIFAERGQDRQAPEEGRRAQRSKRHKCNNDVYTEC